jgi:hypothetical protein
MRESIRKAFASSQLAPPSPGGGGSLELGDAKHRPERAGWGDSLSLRTPPKLKDLHPTPSRISLRSMRADPPPPGEGEGVTTPDSRRSPHFRVLAAQCVRGLGYFQPSWNKEGAGKAGCRLHPWIPCNKKHGGRTTGSTENIRLSLRDGFTVSFVLSPVIGLLATVASRMFLRKTWRQHRGARTTRLRRPLAATFISRSAASTASHRAFVTTRDPPLAG